MVPTILGTEQFYRSFVSNTEVHYNKKHEKRTIGPPVRKCGRVLDIDYIFPKRCLLYKRPEYVSYEIGIYTPRLLAREIKEVRQDAYN